MLSPVDFGTRFEASRRVLWCIAAAVLGDRSRADDVLQEAAVVALGKLDQFDAAAADTSFTAWMGQIVRFVALNESRRHRRERGGSEIIEEDLADRSSAVSNAGGSGGGAAVGGRGELRADQQVFDDRVAAALRTLDETARACLLLRTVMDLGYDDVARALSIPEGTARSHVHRARQALRQRLMEEPRSEAGSERVGAPGGAGRGVVSP